MGTRKRFGLFFLVCAGLLVLTVVCHWFGLDLEAATTCHGGVRHAHTGEMQTLDVAALPQEARDTLKLIKRGGPFPYLKDGAYFGNREKLLPARHKGYYREYTVKTPGSADRGARRIVSGAEGEYYYTDDHYQTFKLIQGALP